jgi:DNA polymerase III sliding clamp (beta) subunit (PCNA family)
MQVSRPVLISTLKKVVAFIPRVKTSDSAGVVTVDPLKDSIRLTLTYPEAAIQTTVGAISDESEDGIRIHGHKFLSMVSVADKEIIFKADEAFAEFRSGKSMWREPMPAPSPFTMSCPETRTCAVDSYTLLTAINTVKYAIDIDSVRPALFMVDVIDGRVRACNGFQYHDVDTKTKGLTFSIPGGMTDGFCSVLRHFDGEIDFYEDDDSYYFKNNGDTISIHKLAAKFPDLDRLLVRPLRSEIPALLQVKRADLRTAVKQVKLVLDDNYPYIELHLNKDEIVVRGTQKSGAEAATSIPSSWASKPRVVTFNVKYLLQTLDSLSDGPLELRFGADTKSKKSPMVMEGSGVWTMLNQSNLSKRA